MQVFGKWKDGADGDGRTRHSTSMNVLSRFSSRVSIVYLVLAKVFSENSSCSLSLPSQTILLRFERSTIYSVCDDTIPSLCLWMGHSTLLFVHPLQILD